MYSFINVLSVFIRQFIMPNPYTNIINNQTYADLFNILIGGTILHISSYTLVGAIYRKGVDFPSTGSLLYLVFYIIFTLLITYVTYFIGSIKISIIVILCIYAILFLILSHISNKRYGIQF